MQQAYGVLEPDAVSIVATETALLPFFMQQRTLERVNRNHIMPNCELLQRDKVSWPATQHRADRPGGKIKA